MRRILLALVVLALLPGTPPAAAQDACGERIVVHSRGALPGFEYPPGLVVGAGACARVFGEDVVARHVLAPGAFEVRVRYLDDGGPAHPTATAVLDGLGFAHASFTLARTTSLLGNVTYEMPYVPIPAGPNASGALRVSVLLPWGGSVNSTYHTFA